MTPPVQTGEAVRCTGCPATFDGAALAEMLGYQSGTHWTCPGCGMPHAPPMGSSGVEGPVERDGVMERRDEMTGFTQENAGHLDSETISIDTFIDDPSHGGETQVWTVSKLMLLVTSAQDEYERATTKQRETAQALAAGLAHPATPESALERMTERAAKAERWVGHARKRLVALQTAPIQVCPLIHHRYGLAGQVNGAWSRFRAEGRDA